MQGGLSDTIGKRGHPRIITAKFGLIWFSGFRGEESNVKANDASTVGRQTMDDGPHVMAKANMAFGQVS